MGPYRRSLSMLLAGLPLIAAAQMDRAPLLAVAPSVVKIEAISDDGRYQLGSGVIVADGKVVTNCHVTRHASKVQVVKHGVRWSVSHQRADMARDLCMLSLPGLEGEAVPIARAVGLRPGQPVMAIGYTGGVGMQLSEGAVIALHRWSGSKLIQSSNWFSSGASGGGLFNAEGALVGILTFRLRGGAAHYFAAPADWLIDRLHDAEGYVPIAPLPGFSYWERRAELQPLFLQAAALERSRQWQALAELAERWTLESSDEAEAAYLLGVAYDELGRGSAAAAALQRSLVLDPGYSRSWARLAQLYKRMGREGDARIALRGLADLDPTQARELSNQLERP